MPGVVRLQESNRALAFLLWNLAENTLRELILKFAKGSHTIVNPIEEEQNRKPG